jgi:hypothetical protein
MKFSVDLSRKQLERIVDAVQVLLWFDTEEAEWDYDKEVNGADFVDVVAAIMSEAGLEPVMEMTAKDIREFNEYLAKCADRQVLGVLRRERDAGRDDYAELARAEARRRQLEEDR